MRRYWSYLKYVVRHKWFVMLECFSHGLIWRGLTHDLSKFRPSEFIPYARHFYNKDGSKIVSTRDKTGYYKPTDTGDKAFDYAWFLHQKRNDHHWEWWIVPTHGGGVQTLPMSEKAVIEMVADWHGASRAQKATGTVAEWFDAHKASMQLNMMTQASLIVTLLKWGWRKWGWR